MFFWDTVYNSETKQDLVTRKIEDFANILFYPYVPRTTRSSVVISAVQEKSFKIA